MVVCQREQERGAQIAGFAGFVFFKVVADLVGNAKRLAESPQGFEQFTIRPGGHGTHQKRDTERGCGFAAENFDDFLGGEGCSVRKAVEFFALTEAERAVVFGGNAQQFRGAVFDGSDPAIAFADEQVAGIDGDRDAVLPVKGRLALAQIVVVLDVVVDE